MDAQDDPDVSDLLESDVEETSSWLFSAEKKEISLEGLFLRNFFYLWRFLLEEILIQPSPSSLPRANSHGATMKEEWESNPVSTLGFIVSVAVKINY